MNKHFFLLLGSALVPFVAALADSQMDEDQSQESSGPIGVYFGGFGGWGYTKGHDIQTGTAFFPVTSIGTLEVDASGKANTSHFGFGGVHLGYEWFKNRMTSFQVSPGIELEALYYAHTPTVHLTNPTDLLDFHEFEDTFPMRTYTVLFNGTLSLDNDYISPYFGVGVGASMDWIHDANSAQVAPLEAGVNHFNSDPNAFNWVFAVQAKAGLRYAFCKHYRLFGEYRFLYNCNSNFTFGPTVYPFHVPTSKWKVDMSSMHYNLFSAGIDFTW